MKSISLTRLPVVDLSVRYSRFVGENTIRHYICPYAPMIVGANNEELLKAQIAKEEGEEIELTLLDNPEADIPPRIISAVDVTLPGWRNRWILKSLNKARVNSTLMQALDGPLWQKISNTVARFLNSKIVHKINGFIVKLLKVNVDDYIASKTKVKLVPPIPFFSKSFVRVIYSTAYLSVAATESELEKAVLALRADLKFLHKIGAIKGHLSLPSMMRLANTVGSGEKVYAVFCFPLIYQKVIADYLKIDMTSMVDIDMMKKLGLKTVSKEGDIQWLDGKPLEKKYTIEEVYLGPTREEMYQQHIAAFDNGLEALNAALAVAGGRIEQVAENPQLRQALLDVHAERVNEQRTPDARPRNED